MRSETEIENLRPARRSMTRRTTSIPAFLLLALTTAFAQTATPPYKNSSLSVDERVKDLLGRMTLEEKVAQMESTWQNYGYPQPSSAYFVTGDGKLDVAKA